jgi:hypothetical protein
VFGFNSWLTAGNLARQQQIGGAPVRRMFVYWESVESASGQWNWQQFDQAYSAVLAAGLRPLIVADGSPCWARPSMPCDDSVYTGPPDPAYDDHWSEFIRRLASRYPSAIGIEIWNEPNLVQNWYPRVDPVRYTQILKAAHGAIKAVRPTMPVVSGGLAGSPATGANTAAEGDQPFLAAMYAAGAGSAMDAIGAHPYPIDFDSAMQPVRWDPAAMEQTLDRLRATRAAAAATQPLWVTEVGESSAAATGYPAPVTPTQQATDLMTMVQAAKADPDVPVFLIHTVDDGPADSGLSAGLGVFTVTGEPKPAVCALIGQLGSALAQAAPAPAGRCSGLKPDQAITADQGRPTPTPTQPASSPNPAPVPDSVPGQPTGRLSGVSIPGPGPTSARLGAVEPVRQHHRSAPTGSAEENVPGDPCRARRSRCIAGRRRRDARRHGGHRRSGSPASKRSRTGASAGRLTRAAR